MYVLARKNVTTVEVCGYPFQFHHLVVGGIQYAFAPFAG